MFTCEPCQDRKVAAISSVKQVYRISWALYKKMYLALARKYRPQTFDKLIGQPHITKTLQNAIKMDRLYPALIFSGMKGVGKTSTARILAKTLNCLKGPTIEPCNKCEICIEITEDRSPDYIEIDGASNNGVEEIRNLREKIRYKPFKNNFRVVVIDEVHMLSNSAWNALLKTIEEPPEHTYFILATTDFQKIPSTIVSRSQHYEFRQIPNEIIIKVLKEISKKEKIKISDYGLFLVANAAEGSLRDAKKILDQAIALSSGDIDDNSLRDILGVIEEDIFIQLVEGVFGKDRKKIVEMIENIVERGIDLRFFYNEYLKFFRELMVIKMLGTDNSLHNLNPSKLDKVQEIIKDVSEVELLRYFNTTKDLEITVRNTQNPRIILEYLFLKLSFFPSIRSIEEILNDLKTDKLIDQGYTEQLAVREAPITHSKESALNEKKEINNDDVLKLFKKNMAKETPRLLSLAENSHLKIKGNLLTIRVEAKDSHLKELILEKKPFLLTTLKEISNNQINELKVELDEPLEKDEKSKDIDKIKGFAEEINLELIDIKDIKGGKNA